MTNILVVDDMPIFREPIAAALRGAGYNSLTAANGKEALARLQSEKVEAVLLDVAMPVMDGITCLGLIRSNPSTSKIPVILLTAVSEKPHILAAAKFGIQDYLLKSRFSLQELLARIAKCVNGSAAAPSSPASAAAPVSAPAPAQGALIAKKELPAPAPRATPDVQEWPRLLTRDQTLARLDQVSTGKTIAGVVAQVISVASSPDADLTDLIRVISSDPLLASRVVMLANSASTGSRTRVATVDDAARVVGVRGIQSMAISIGIFGTFPPDEGDGFNSMRCWQHSVAVAELMGLIARSRKPEQEGLNHLVGLCHDLGEILLRQHFSLEHEKIVQFAVDHGLPLHQVETTALGIRHPELISRLMTRMGLPANVVDLIREFYERQIKENAAGLSSSTQLLNMANAAAHGMLLSASTQERVRPYLRTEWRIIDPEKSPPQFDVAAKRNEIVATTNTMARLPAREEARFMAPLIEKRSVKILYVRPAIFIEFDPLAYALQLTCDMTLASALPPAEELRNFDGVVVAGIRVGTGVMGVEDWALACQAAGKPAMPILAVVTQEHAAPKGDNWTVKVNGLRLIDIDQWLGGIAMAPRQGA